MIAQTSSKLRKGISGIRELVLLKVLLLTSFGLEFNFRTSCNQTFFFFSEINNDEVELHSKSKLKS